MQKFDGIFDGDDVPVHVLVDVVQYRSERRGLSASGGAGDQNETPGFMSYPLHHLWKDEILEGAYGGRYRADRDRWILPLLKDIYTKPAQALNAIADVYLRGIPEMLFLFIVHDGKGHHETVFFRQLSVLPQRYQFSVDTDMGKRTYFEVQVGGTFAYHGAKQGIKVHRNYARTASLGLVERTPGAYTAVNHLYISSFRPST